MFDFKFAEELIDAALTYGADDAEIYCSTKQETEIMAGNGQAETVSIRSDTGFAVRVLRDSRMAFASSNLSARKAAVDLVKDVTERALLHSPDENNVIPEAIDRDVAGVEEPYDSELESLPLSAKIEKTLNIEKAAKAYDSRVQGFAWLQYGDSVQEFSVVNSRGIRARSRGSIAYAFAYAIAGDGKSVQTGTHAGSTAYFDKLSATEIGETVAEYAVRMLGAGSYKTGEYHVVFPPETNTALLGAVADMLSADQVQKGKSPFRDRLGDMVASEIVTVTDDGLMPGGLATSPYDSEGVPSSTTVLIKNGKLKTFLYDSYSAKKGKTDSTGNASRANYHAQPSITPTNLYLRPGNISQSDLIRSIQDGLYITELSGLHAGINPTTADVSIPAKALVIRNGEFAGGVDNITISGNLLDLYRKVDSIADDLTWIPGNGMLGAPTMSIPDVKVTGHQ